MRRPIDDLDREILLAISEYWHDAGRSPTFRELGNWLRINPSTARYRARGLAARGFLRFRPHGHRAIEVVVVPAPDGLAARLRAQRDLDRRTVDG